MEPVRSCIWRCVSPDITCVARRTPIPFIADDIMETFNDSRAEEAFRLFAEMGMHGQVIYFTHHKHLTQIAKKLCPSVRLHDLQEVGRAGGLRVVVVAE